MGTEPSALDFAGIPRVWRPRASPTGEHIAFFWNPGERYELFVYEVNADEYRQVTDGESNRSPNAPIIWAPSGDALYFQTGEHGYAIGEIHRLSIDGSVEQIATIGDDWGMLWGVNPTDEWLLYSQAGQLYRYDIERESSTQLSGPGTTVPNRGARIAPEGDRVCYPGNATSEAGNSDAYVVDATGENPFRLPISGTEQVRPQAWHPDGYCLLIYDTEADRTGEFNLETEETRWFGLGTPITYLDKRTILTKGPDYLYDHVSGEKTELESGGNGDELVAEEVCLDNERIVYTYGSELRPWELYCYDVNAGEEERLVAADFGQVDPDAFVAAEDIIYESVEGREVEGLLYRPEHADKTNPVRVVVEAHGFPAEASRRFKPKIQFLISRGYAVLEPNFRGAENREEGFAESIKNDWGGAEQDDVAAAASWLTDQDWVIPDRIALFGHSFGGFTVYTQMVRKPDTWTVGIASGGMTDLHSLDAAKDGNELLREQMGHPRDNAALWYDRSPITHVQNIERPLLILHGTADPTAPVSQAWAFKGALEAVKGWSQGDEFEYEEIESGEHGNLDRETDARRWDAIIDFLDRRL